MAGIRAQQEVTSNRPPVTPNNPLTNQYNLYNSGVQQNAEDYGGIMQGYRNLLGTAGGGPNRQNQSYTPAQVQTQQYNYSPPTVSPQTTPYRQSGDLTSAIGNMSGLAQSGGYTPEGIADIRARGISPIRSIYAGANRDIDRNRVLKGGFSPGYNAAKLKMAREMSDQIGNQVTNVNAGIAQNVAQNRLNIAPQLAGATGQQSNLANQMAETNTGAINQGNLANVANQMQANRDNSQNANQANFFNANASNEANRFNAQNNQQNQQQGQNQQLQALQGMQSLYGTTPALSQLFGNQAMNASQFQNQINQQGNQANQNMINTGMEGIRRAG